MKIKPIERLEASPERKSPDERELPKQNKKGKELGKGMLIDIYV